MKTERVCNDSGNTGTFWRAIREQGGGWLVYGSAKPGKGKVLNARLAAPERCTYQMQRRCVERLFTRHAERSATTKPSGGGAERGGETAD